MPKTPKKESLNKKITRRFNILSVFVLLVMAILLYRLFDMQIRDNNIYMIQLEERNEVIVQGISAPRGKIYDRNGKLLVDNEAVRVITYKTPSGISTTDELELAKRVAEIIEMPTNLVTTRDKKDLWLVLYPSQAKNLITDDEMQRFHEGYLKSTDIYYMKLNRITSDDLSIFDEPDMLEMLAVFTEMRRGFSSDIKIIKGDNVTTEEFAIISETLSDLPGFDTGIDWIRTYPYDSTFKTILGKVSTTQSGIPAELLEKYLALGYERNDRVGTTNIEYQYEQLLRGVKPTYLVNPNGTYTIIEDGSRGKDIVLTIDIELQRQIEAIVEEELLLARSEEGTEFYDTAYVIVTAPNTGEVLAMVGRKIVMKEDGTYYYINYNTGVVNTLITVGSIVKPASMITAYNEGVISFGEMIYDTPLQILNTPEKSSWKNLGLIDDLEALEQSSNIYQYLAAIEVGGGEYVPNEALVINPEAFDIYRNTYIQFGLGQKTGIDLPTEGNAYLGSGNLPGYLLDLSIGQYDNYTPIQIAQYTMTLANSGVRVEPTLLKYVFEPTEEPLTELIYQKNPVVLNTVETSIENIERVQEGMELVLTDGTGRGYMDLANSPAGKTGSSESWLDTDGDGIIDEATVSKTFIGYAPSDAPEVTFTVLSPHIASVEQKSTEQTKVNQRISRRVSDLYFQIY